MNATYEEIELAKALLAVGAPAASADIHGDRVMCAEWDKASPANRAGLIAVARFVRANFTPNHDYAPGGKGAS